MSTPTALLYQYSPAWNLPTASPECLKTQTYLMFAGIMHSVRSCDSPNASASGVLPMVFDGSHELSGSDEIIEHFKTKGFNLDRRLSDAERAETKAFTALVEEKLNTVLLHHLWADDRNFYKSTRGVFTKGTYFPLSLVESFMMRRDRLAVLNFQHFDGEDSPYQVAAECYNALQTRLGNGPYFYGNSPTVLDAVVFGHLAIHLYAEYPNNRLRALLQEYHGLVRFCNSIRDMYYRDIAPAVPATATPETDKLESSKQKDQNPVKKPTLTPEEKALRKRRKYVAITAALALVGYWVSVSVVVEPPSKPDLIMV